MEVSFEKAINAAKVAFCWNSTEDELMKMGRRITNATNNCSGAHINAGRAAKSLPQIL